MRRKILYKTISIIAAFIIGLSPLNTLIYSYAVDSPEEIARQEEEARREAARRAEREAKEKAREAKERAWEAIEDMTPTPTLPPQPTPTTDLTPTITETQTTENTETNSSNNNITNTGSNVNVENNNSGQLNNNVEINSNTGNNTISEDNPPTKTPTPTISSTPQDPLPQCEEDLTVAENTGGEEDSFSHDATEIVQTTDSNQIASQGEEDSKDSSSENTDTVTISNNNCASIKNDQFVSSISGNNNASENEGSELTTGNTTSNSSLINEANKNTVSGSQSTAETNNSEESTNTENQNTDKVTVDNNNQIYAENNVNVESISGGNTVNDNDGQAILTTGDIDILVTLLNILNLNITGEDFTHLIVNIFGDLTGDIDLDKIAKNLGISEEELEAIARNEETEAQRNEDIRNMRTSEVDVNNSNEAVVRNNVNVKGVSGENDASGNEDRTKIITGRIKILVALINFINTNYVGSEWYFAMVNIFGSLKGDLILPDPNGFLVDDSQTISSDTGQNLTNSLVEEDKRNIEIFNSNQASVSNNIKATGDSGSNTAYGNEDRVNQESGNVNVLVNLTNWLNINIFGNNWVLLVINVFGRWYGKILGFPGQGDIEAPESGMLMVAAGGKNGSGPAITDTNPDTGGTLENSENLNIDNSNKATLENNVEIEGVSGRNVTNNNKDPVSVITGWIDITADLFNIVNLNVVGKKWMLVLVNIFGDFIGNITFPGVKKAAIPEFSLSTNDNISDNPKGGFMDENQPTDRETTNAMVDPIITPTPFIKVQKLSQGDNQENNIDNNLDQEKIIEVYKAENVNNNQPDLKNENQRGNEVKILGISLNVGYKTQQILFLIALISYLIALRFIAIRKH